MPDRLPDPCTQCGFDGRGLNPADLLATIRSLPRRWGSALSRDPENLSEPAVKAANDALLAAAGAVRGVDRPAFSGGTPSTLAGLTATAEALADALEGADDPFARPGVREAVVAAAHAGTHHVRTAERAVDDATEEGSQEGDE